MAIEVDYDELVKRQRAYFPEEKASMERFTKEGNKGVRWSKERKTEDPSTEDVPEQEPQVRAKLP